MYYYEVLIADGRYYSDAPLTYAFEKKLHDLSVVTVPLQARTVTGFVTAKVKKPAFETKEIKALVSEQPLPPSALELARWLSVYYGTGLGDALRQFAPAKPAIRNVQIDAAGAAGNPALHLDSPLTDEQQRAIKKIGSNPHTTVLLHGETGTGKTRVYLELAKKVLAKGKNALLLTPEISLTPQLALAAQNFLDSSVIVLHSQLSPAQRKKIWKQILEADKPLCVVGPRSALFAPLKNIGLIVLDEAHEPAYKQDQSPRYLASRVASQLGAVTGAKVILGTATPLLTDYYLASEKNAVIRMTKPAISGDHKAEVKVVDLKKRENFARNPYLSNELIDQISKTLAAKKQVLLYLNRRGSARIILCKKCGWEMLCPNCDIPLVYHGDSHETRCHTCGYKNRPPINCPVCKNPDIVYKSIGTKALAETAARLFPQARIARFDSDNSKDEQINELYGQIRKGAVDILVGTQILAKGLDLPKLALVGVVSAESSMGLPDFSSEERSFQLLYQVMGRVGRGHGESKVILQTYDPASEVVKAAIKRDFGSFYDYAVHHRQKFRFPPFSYLMQITCRRLTEKGALAAAQKLKVQLAAEGLPVEIIGPSPGFYKKSGRYYNYQLVLKSKQRNHLLKLAGKVPAGFTVNLDPINLL